MNEFLWLIWVLLGVVLIVAEIFTLGFVLFWFGLGAFAAAIAGYFGAPLGIQFLIFAVSSIVLTVLSRTIFAKYYSHDDNDRIKTGIEALPGKIGTVTADSSGSLNEAAVKVFGSTWTAFPADPDEQLRTGEKVEVVEVRGSSLYVRAVRQGLPDWRT